MVPFNVMVHERNRWPTMIAASDCCHERPTASIVLAKSYVPQLYASVILEYKAKKIQISASCLRWWDIAYQYVHHENRVHVR